MVRALDAGYLQLCLDAQLAIESQTGEARDVVLKYHILWARTQWVANARAGAVDPCSNVAVPVDEWMPAGWTAAPAGTPIPALTPSMLAFSE